MLGSNDKRVPYSQGLEMFRALRALGKKVKVNVYGDCHPLRQVDVNTDVSISTALFFRDILTSE